MTYYFVKLAITGLLIVTISEISKRNIFLGGLLASLPLVSYLALIWVLRGHQGRGEDGGPFRQHLLACPAFARILPAFFVLAPE
jgi:hypothetical protein